MVLKEIEQNIQKEELDGQIMTEFIMINMDLMKKDLIKMVMIYMDLMKKDLIKMDMIYMDLMKID